MATARRRSKNVRRPKKKIHLRLIPDSDEWERQQRKLEEKLDPPGLAPVDGKSLRVLASFLDGRKLHFLPVLGPQCISTAFDKPTFFARIQELFPTALRAKGGNSPEATRLLLRFYDVAPGVRIALQGLVTDEDKNLVLCRLQKTDANGNGGERVTQDEIGEITVTNGFAFAVYEVVLVDPTRINRIEIGVRAAWNANTPNDFPSTGNMQVSACLGPVSTVYPLPVGSSYDFGVPTTVFAIVRCSTFLLFPFVTNQAGWDTGIAISNTSSDPLGTANQAGPVRFFYYGRMADGGPPPKPQTTTAIGAGSQLTFTVSGGNSACQIAGTPGFQGHVVAECQFQYAVGFASITNNFGVGIPTIAQSYVAQVIGGYPGGRKPQ